jgi:hypothetical protein
VNRSGAISRWLAATKRKAGGHQIASRLLERRELVAFLPQASNQSISTALTNGRSDRAASRNLSDSCSSVRGTRSDRRITMDRLGPMDMQRSPLATRWRWRWPLFAEHARVAISG